VAETTFATKTDGGAWLTAREAEILAGEWRAPEPGKETFGSYGKRWLAHRVDLRPTTAELYAILWRVWLEPELGDVTLAEMSPEMWRSWFVQKTTEHPKSTQPGKAYRLARAMLNTAVEDGVLRANPCRVKGAGREEAAERPVATSDEVLKIAEVIDSRYRALVLVGAFCSLRFGELAGLRRRRFNELHKTITVEEQAVELAGGKVQFGPPKTAAGRRVVAIPDELASIVTEHLDAYVDADPDALIFTSPEGHPLRRTKFLPRWLKACKAVGVTGLHFHDLRGSGATWAAADGATVRELMGRLGHTTPTVALRYQHATQERDRAIADKLGARMRPSSEADNRTEVVSLPLS